MTICGLACNVIVQHNDNNETRIYTSSYLAEQYEEQITEEGVTNLVLDDYTNRKAIAYNMIVVSKGGRVGVIDPELKDVIGTKYRHLEFSEFNKTFIATSYENNKVGIIDRAGRPIIDLKYDIVRVISHRPVLYEVRHSGKAGIVDEMGRTIVEAEYDSLGYQVISTGATDRRGSVLIIQSVDGEQDAIVVSRAGKYGLVNIKTGEVIFGCQVDAIYSRTNENDEKTYHIELQKTPFTLEEYLNYVNR